LLRPRPEREDQVVAFDRCAAELVQGGVEQGGEVRVRAGEVVVARLLHPRPRRRLGRVPDGMREEWSTWIAPEIERLPADAPADVARDECSVRRIDVPALDRELGDDLDRVVASGSGASVL